MAPIPVLAPLSGRVVAMSDVPDDVFAAEMVGPGLAIDPLAADEASREDPSPGNQGTSTLVALAPISGRVFKLFPHAFAIAREVTGQHAAVLVHLGIDTVKLKGDGFRLLDFEGDEASAGDPIAAWDPTPARNAGFSTLVPVIALDTKPERLTMAVTPGDWVHAGDVLYTIGKDRVRN